MNNYKNILLSGMVFVTVSFNVANANDVLGVVDLSANVGLYSEYVFRGISQSDEAPALQGGFDASHESGLYAGVWGSNVNFNDGDQAHIEIDAYGGYAGEVDNFNYDVGAIYYAYPGANSSLNYDFYELAASIGYDFDVLSTTASINYSPEYFGNSGDAIYYAGTVEAPIYKDVSASAHIGYQTVDDNDAFGVPDYIDWSVGLNYNYQDFDLSVTYIDTDLKEPTECSDGCDSRIVLGIAKSF